MKRLSFKNIWNIIVLILLIGFFFDLVPIKYNGSTKEYNGYYYSYQSKKIQAKDPIKVKLVFKSYTKFHLFKLTKSDEFKGELFINNTKYDIKRLNFINDKSMHNKYIGQIKNNKSNYNFSTIFISEDLNMASISNYNKNYDIWCTTKDLNDMKNLDMKFFKE
ncbi:hypothetical protein WBZ18_09705 [Clostridium botulinum]|uniref:Uncharacterized protein n=1 Tax=Clostridium botulinum (strain 657 / Type Ba4) TaxID=515621 RepID=A0A3F3A295_CLOB6|nr:hypothetical protein [Clostridium botulinum]AJD27810.1 hypothetical protein T257_1266 [Clostridium botulinum CDC_297]ACQ54580.1 hypothetical protein CLJ_B0504 [Clostridium botulinum Ba4 str. 657]APR00713.1 hypothetical protein RSJ2_492 [Clostridium botulinum]APU59348.1 hypothetical protein NPD8_1306 [Clostridium botulinum]AXG92328.1 hypothetical protein AGE29_11255 [Clostridium botulinum]